MVVHEPQQLPELVDDSKPDWSRAASGFLEEKLKRSGSRSTVDAYGSNLHRFFDEIGKTPDQVKPQDVWAFGYGTGPSGNDPSVSTINLRIAAISSFYRFLMRMGWMESNPADRVQRPHVEPSQARGLPVDEVGRLFDAIPNTMAGKRDRAIILTLIMTGRRRSEVLGLRAGDLTGDGPVIYSYRGKGGKSRKRELAERQIEEETARLLSYRVITLQNRGQVPNHESSAVKLYASELSQRIAATSVKVMGLFGQLDKPEKRGDGSATDRWTPNKGKFMRAYLNTVSSTIAGGTSEVNRNVMATRGLGLPRD